MSASNQAKIEQAIALIRDELGRVERKHGFVMASPHEGNSIIREEYEELWEHVRANTGRSEAAGREACQIGAMAIKYMINFDPRLQEAFDLDEDENGTV